MAADAPRPGERARIQTDAPDLDDELVDVLALEEEILAADAEAETELDAETEVDAKPTLEEDPIERAGRLCRAAQSGAIDHGFLEANEVPPGHTLEKHVGKDDEYLRDRLAQEKIESVSTFTDLTKAERAVAMAPREVRSDRPMAAGPEAEPVSNPVRRGLGRRSSHVLDRCDTGVEHGAGCTGEA